MSMYGPQSICSAPQKRAQHSKAGGHKRNSASSDLQTLVEAAHEDETEKDHNGFSNGDIDISKALPRPETFRQSRFMPHLSARFSLLRDLDPIDQDHAFEQLERLLYEDDPPPKPTSHHRDSKISKSLPRPETFRTSRFMPHLSARFSLLKDLDPSDQDATLDKLEGIPRKSASILGQKTKGSMEISRWAPLRSCPPDKKQFRAQWKVVEMMSDDGSRRSRSSSILALCREIEQQPGDGLRLAAVLAALCLVFLLVALDRTMITTAIPRITDDFHSLGDMGWYLSAYLALEATFLLAFTRLYAMLSAKRVIVPAILLFMLGSVISGAAPSSTTLIIGRAIAGLGAAGISSGVMAIVTEITPLHRRSTVQATLGAVFGIASILGPLLGGLFAESWTWRFCFFINVPIAILTIPVLLFVLKTSKPTPTTTLTSDGRTPVPHPPVKKTFLDKIQDLNPLGTGLFLASLACLLIPLTLSQTPSSSKPLNIALYILSLLLLLTAYISQRSIPLRLLKNRTILFGAWTQLFIGGSMFATLTFLPIWFQTVKAASPLYSGLLLLPLVGGMVAVALLSAVLVPKVGFYTPFLITGTALIATAAAFMSTLTPAATREQYLAYPIIFGVGLGMAMQQTCLAARTVLQAGEDAVMGISLMGVCQALGGAVFVAVSQNVFVREMISGLRRGGFAEDDVVGVVKKGVSGVLGMVNESHRVEVLGVVNGALTKVFQLVVITSCLALVGALLMEWRSVKGMGDDGSLAVEGEKNEYAQ